MSLISDAVRPSLMMDLADYKEGGLAHLELRLTSPSIVARYNRENPFIVAFGSLSERLHRIEYEQKLRAKQSDACFLFWRQAC